MSADTQQNTMSDAEDSIPLNDDGDIRLPIVEILTGRGFITGKSGSGKSNSASVIAEELLDRGFPLLIVDTDGEYWGLKESYEILHVGADEECDLQVGPEHAEKLASLALDDGVPIILDVSGYINKDDAKALVREVARSLFTKEKKRKQPFLILVEEIHEYIPEGGGFGDTGQMLVKIGKRGRKHGLGLAGISQRPADVKKDFITQCDWLCWHRLTWENDTQVVRRVADRETADAVQDLDDGEGFFMADFLEEDLNRVQVRRKRTFDAGATPDLEDFERPDLKSVSGDLVGELEEITDREERRQNRIAALETELTAREERIAELEAELENARDMTDMAQQFTEGMMQSGGDGGVAEEKLNEIIEERNSLQNDLEDREARIDELKGELDEARQELRERPEISERASEAVEVLADEFGVGGEDSQRLRQKLKTARKRIDEMESDADSEASGSPENVQKSLLNEFQQEAVNRLLERADSLSSRQKKLLKYIEARGNTLASQKNWAKTALGLSGNPNTTHYDAMGDLIEDGFARKNKDGSIAPNFRGLLEKELDGYDVDEETIDATHEEVLSRL